MLGKLLKYEIRSTARLFLPIYFILLVVAIINKFAIVLLPENPISSIIQNIAMITFVLLILAVIVMCFAAVIQRFYKNLLTEEGYLMFTLPVKESSLILSKAIIAVMWLVASVVVIIASIFIVIPDYNFLEELIHVFDTLRVSAINEGVNFDILALLFIGVVVTGVISFVIEIYVALSMGQLSNSHKSGMSFVAYIVIYMIKQAVSSAFLLIVMSGLGGIDMNTLVFDVEKYIYAIFGMSLFISVGVMVGGFFVTKHVLKNKLNLS